MINPKAIKAISTVTGLDSDLSEFIIEEIEQSEFKIDSIDEDKMAEIIGEHLVNFSVVDSSDSAWIVCDKLIKAFRDFGVEELSGEYFEEEEDSEEELKNGVCLICEREMPLTFHHLIPKSTHKKMIKQHGYTKLYLNTHGIDICRPCHSQIHRLIPLDDMAMEYNTLEKVLSHSGVQSWIPWIRKQKRTSRNDRRTLVQHRNLILPKEDLIE